MPRSGLSSRLKQLRGMKEGRAEAAPAPAAHPAVEHTHPELIAQGFEAEGDYFYRRSELIPDLAPPARSGLFLPSDIDPHTLLFFDLETTGLSGGAGTVAFLAGFGRYTEGGLLLDQLFLSDYPGEGEFLSAVDGYLSRSPETALVSYNGRSFDAHLLRTRGLMNGIRFRTTAHFDLLYLSRRLWRSRIGSCSLGRIESEVLGLTRGEDLPGGEVPERWFAFLKDGEAEGLREVFSHHRQDIVSLAILLDRIERILADPAGSGEDGGYGIDKRALGVYLLSRRVETGELLLRHAFEEGDVQAGALLAIALKRRGAWEEALEVWRRADALEPRSAVCVELAKYYEHRHRSYAEALAWAKKGVDLLPAEGARPARREALLYRIERLERKLGG